MIDKNIVLKIIDEFIEHHTEDYLDRKYNKYLDFCRSEEKSSELLQSKIGEDCDVDTEITTL